MKETQTPLAYFRAISAIPRVSGNEKAVADYVQREAQTLGCTVLRDEMNNLVIKKPASHGCEQAPPFILQGHLDMVGEAAAGVTHDFASDPIRLVEDGDILRADGTTLGADDGVAVALILALLADECLCHPALECVLTVQEETGLYGAMGLDTTALKGRRMLNLDAGPEGIFVVSCAGGCRAELRGELKWQSAAQPMWRLEVSNLRGGHSGSAIAAQGANAISLVGTMLDALEGQGAQIGKVWAGDKDNVIPAHAEAEFSFPDNPAAVLAPLAAAIRSAWASTDPEMSITWTKSEGTQTLRADCARTLLDLLLLLPHGVASTDTAMSGLVETSSNLAVVKTHPDVMELHVSMRSSSDFRKGQLIRRVERLANRLGLTCSLSGMYPGWAYDPESPLRDMAAAAFRSVYGKDPRFEGIHAGLECGVLKGALPDLDIIATGPLYGGMHTPDEWLDMPSLERTYSFIKELLHLSGEQAH